MEDGFTPYQRAINKLVKDQGSLAFSAIVETLQERRKELDALWISEQDKSEFDPDRLRGMKRGATEIKKLIGDIERARVFFAEPDPTIPAAQPASQEVPDGPGY